MNPDDQRLALAFAKTDTTARTIVQEGQVAAGGTITLTSHAHDELQLFAGSDPSAGASSVALALSIREARAETLVIANNFDLPVFNYIEKFRFDGFRAGGAISMTADVTEDITMTALSGDNAAGTGQAIVLSIDNSMAKTAITGVVSTDDDDFTIEAKTVFETYDLMAAVNDDDVTVPSATLPAGSLPLIGTLADSVRGSLGAVLEASIGQVFDGAAAIVDVSNTQAEASFGRPMPFPLLTFPTLVQGGRVKGLLTGRLGDLASDDTSFTVRAVTDLGEGALTTHVGTPTGEGAHRGGSLIWSSQTRLTDAAIEQTNIGFMPEITVTSRLIGDQTLEQRNTGGADASLSFGYLNAGFDTLAAVKSANRMDGALTVKAREALNLINRQIAETSFDGFGGTLGLALTLYDATVLAEVADSGLAIGIEQPATIIADSLSTLETIAARNGSATNNNAQLSAAIAVSFSKGETIARLTGGGFVERSALTVEATDKTWRQVVADASAEGDTRNVLGAISADTYARDTRAMVDAFLLSGMAEDVRVIATSATHLSSVSIGRAVGSASPLALTFLGTLLRDDRDVIAPIDLGSGNLLVNGDVTVTATRNDSVILLQGTEASGNSGAGLAWGQVATGGETRAELLFEAEFYEEFEGEEFEGEDFEGDEDGGEGEASEEIDGNFVGGNIHISAEDATTVFNLSLGGGTTSVYGGAGAFADLRLGRLGDGRAIVGVTDALLDDGSARSNYGAEAESIRDGLGAQLAAEGIFKNGRYDPSDPRETAITARIGMGGGSLLVIGDVTVEATDRRVATGLAGQIQAGVVAPATNAFTTYFEVDSIADNGVTLSLRPETVGEAVGTAVDIYSTGDKAASALGDFSDAIKNGASFSTDATTAGAALAATVIGGSVVAEIDLRAETGRDGGFGAFGAIRVETTLDTRARANAFGAQIGNSALGASVSHARMNQLSSAAIIGGSLGAGSVTVRADNASRASTIGGMLAGASGTGAGAGAIALVDLDAVALAEVVDANVISLVGNIRIDAQDDSRALGVVVAGAAGSGGLGAAGTSIGVVSQRSLVRAGAIGSSLTAMGQISVSTSQNSLTNALVAQAAVSGGTVGVGLAIADVDLRAVTEALLLETTTATSGAGADIVVAAASDRQANAAAVGAAAGGTVGVVGSISMITREDQVRALVVDGTLDAADSIAVSAVSDFATGALGGGGEGMLSGLGAANVAIGGGGTVGVGVSVSRIRGEALVEALVQDGSDLTARGTAADDGITVQTRLAADNYAARQSVTRHGVAVVADAQSDADMLALSATAAGAVALSVQAPTIKLADAVNAEIAGGSVTSGAALNVLAGNESDIRLLNFVAQASGGAAAGGASIETIGLAKQTTARLATDTVDATTNVNVRAVSPDTLTTFSASLSVSPNVAAAGVFQTLRGTSLTQARIDGGMVTAGGNVTLRAISPRAVTQNGTNITIGTGVAGVGATVITAVLEDETTAETTGNVVIDADDDVTVTAEASLDLSGTVVGGAGGFVALSGAVFDARLAQQVHATLGDGTRLIADQTDDLVISALHLIDQSGTVGNVTGGGAAVGGALATLRGTSDVLARIGANAVADVTGDVTVRAEGIRNIDLNSVAIGGGGASLQGSFTQIAFGDAFDGSETEATRDLIVSDLQSADALDYDGGDGRAAGELSDATDLRQATALGLGTKSGDAIRAEIGTGASVEGAGSVTVEAVEGGLIDPDSGGISGGPFAFSAALTRVEMNSNVTLDVGTNARVQSGSTVTLRSLSDLDMDRPLALAGAGLGVGAGYGAVAETFMSRRVTLDLGEGVVLGDGGAGTADVMVEAQEMGETTATASGAGIAAVAAGGVFATARNDSLVRINSGAVFGSTNGPVIQGDDITIKALRDGAVSAAGVGLAAGVVSGSALDVLASDDSVTRVRLGRTRFEAKDTVTFDLRASSDLEATANGVELALGVAAGLTFAKAERLAKVTLDTTAISVAARNLDLTVLDALGSGASAAAQITAKSFSVTGGGYAGIGGGETRATNETNVTATLVLSDLDLAGDLTGLVGSNAAVDAGSFGVTLGFTALGANKSVVTNSAIAALTIDVASGSATNPIDGDVDLTVVQSDRAEIATVSGQGGIYTVDAARSDLTLGGSGTLTFDGGLGVQIGGTLGLRAERTSEFQNEANGLSAALAQYGGTKLTAGVSTSVELLVGGTISADAYDMLARTALTKTEDGPSGRLGSVGVLDGTSLVSDTDVATLTLLTIRDGAVLTETGSSGVTDSDTAMRVETALTLVDSVKIDTGGGILVPSARSLRMTTSPGSLSATP